MSILPLLHIAFCIGYTYLAVYVLTRSIKSPVNRVASALIFCFAIWSFSKIFLHNPLVPKETAIFFDNLGTIGSFSFSSFFLWFTLKYTKRKWFDNIKILEVLFLVIPAPLIYKQFSGVMNSEYILMPYGWNYVWSRSIWVLIFFIYYISFLSVSLFLLFQYSGQKEALEHRKQTLILAYCLIASFILGTITDVVMPVLGLSSVPDIANLLTVIWASGLVYAMVKYKFMELTPSLAAGKIISMMNESLVLLNAEGKIMSINASAQNLLGYGYNELNGKHCGILFKDKSAWPVIHGRLRGERTINEYNSAVITKSGISVDVTLSGSIVEEKKGNPGGIICIFRDITERKRMEAALRDSEERFRNLIEGQGEGIAIMDLNNTFIFANPAAHEIFGVINNSLTGKKLNEYTDEKNMAVITEQTTLRRGGITSVYEHEIIRRDGKTRTLLVTAAPQLNDEGKVIGIFGTFRDITDRKQKEDELQTLSIKDELTGLYNRRGFFTLFAQHAKISKITQKEILLFYFDLDSMKTINDRLGHKIGDQALIDTAAILTKTFRKSDVIARCGGDEFIALVLEAQAGTVEIIRKRLEAQIKSHNDIEKKPYSISLSMGIVAYNPKIPRSVDDLIAEADRMMYEQKKQKSKSG